MADIETRFPENIFLNSIISTRWLTEITSYGSGTESVNIVWQYPLKSFAVPQHDLRENIDVLHNWFMAAQGRGKAFRYKDPYDYKSTANMASTVTANDQSLGDGDGATLTFQARKAYVYVGETVYRKITKLVSGTALISIEDVPQTNGWSVDNNTGIFTFDADNTGSITNITKASNAVITSSAHGLVVDDTVHISGVSGMTEIEGLRGTVLSKTVNTFTLDINSSGFSTYTSGGNYHTIPQSGETVKAGFEYDVRVRFDQDQLDIILVSGTFQKIDSLLLIEKR